MITVLYYKNNYCVGVFGHAESGEPGHDLVCAAASMLVHTLAAYLKKRDEDTDVYSEVEDGKVLPGMALIGCTPDEEEAEAVREVFDAVCNGFALLAQYFPKNVEYFERPEVRT